MKTSVAHRVLEVMRAKTKAVAVPVAPMPLSVVEPRARLDYVIVALSGKRGGAFGHNSLRECNR